MRLDLFLKSSRIVLRRSLGQKFCDANLVKVNDVVAKSSKEIKTGDEIEIKRGKRLTKIKVLEIPAVKQVSRADAENLYEIISEETLADEIFS
ncbi:MAG TPA: S4 domain-containing protein [Pyrinomonadaceae bacterium]|nr:S4 domain-containing protein [Pyrinomonadaceae bacterium]